MTSTFAPEQISVAIKRAAPAVHQVIVSGPFMGMEIKDALHFTMAAAIMEAIPESKLMTVWADGDGCSFSLGHLVRVGEALYHDGGLAPASILEDWFNAWQKSTPSAKNYRVTLQEGADGLSELYERASWRRLFTAGTEELSRQLSIVAQESALDASTPIGPRQGKLRL